MNIKEMFREIEAVTTGDCKLVITIERKDFKTSTEFEISSGTHNEYVCMDDSDPLEALQKYKDDLKKLELEQKSYESNPLEASAALETTDVGDLEWLHIKS